MTGSTSRKGYEPQKHIIPTLLLDSPHCSSSEAQKISQHFQLTLASIEMRWDNKANQSGNTGQHICCGENSLRGKLGTVKEFKYLVKEIKPCLEEKISVL